MRPFLLILFASLGLGCMPGESREQVNVQAEEVASTSSRHLFVWTGDKDESDSDFLAVIDIDRESASYAEVVATVPASVNGAGKGPKRVSPTL